MAIKAITTTTPFSPLEIAGAAAMTCRDMRKSPVERGCVARGEPTGPPDRAAANRRTIDEDDLIRRHRARMMTPHIPLEIHVRSGNAMWKRFRSYRSAGERAHGWSPPLTPGAVRHYAEGPLNSQHGVASSARRPWAACRQAARVELTGDESALLLGVPAVMAASVSLGAVVAALHLDRGGSSYAGQSIQICRLLIAVVGGTAQRPKSGSGNGQPPRTSRTRSTAVRICGTPPARRTVSPDTNS